MGVIRPPWISKEWFSQCPFNYCDHLGDKKLLATVCKICKEELERLQEYKKRGEDPYDMRNVLNDVGKDLETTMAMVTKKAQELGIDLENLPDEPEPPPHESYPIFNIIQKYGNRIEKAMKKKYLQLAKLSLDICEIIRKEFFPEHILDYEEFGYNEFSR